MRTPRAAGRKKWLAAVLSGFIAMLAALRNRKSASINNFTAFDSNRSLWMFNHYAIAPDMAGGTRHYELATLLREHGWQTTIFAAPHKHKASDPNRKVSPGRPVLEAHEQGVDFVWLYSLPYQRNNWRRYVNMVSFLVTSTCAGCFRPRPDVVIGSSPHLLAALGAWIVAQRHRVPFILEVRDMWPESLVQLGLSNRPVVFVLESIESFLYQNADQIIALTEGISTGISSKDVAEDKIVLISNAAMRPGSLDASERLASRAKFGWRDAFVVIWIGAHGPANGLDVLVDSARLMDGYKDVKFVLVGDGSEKPKLMSIASDLANIEFMDPVPKTDVQTLLRATDLGVIVHRDTKAVKGARPNKLFDYMAAGLPILLNLDGEARRMVEGAGAGMFIEAESARAIVDGLLELKDSTERRQEMSERGYAMAQGSYSREDTATLLADVLNSIIEHPRWDEND